MAMNNKHTWFFGEPISETKTYPVAGMGQFSEEKRTLPEISSSALPYDWSGWQPRGCDRRLALNQAYLYKLKYYLIACRSLMADSIEFYKIGDDPMELN